MLQTSGTNMWGASYRDFTVDLLEMITNCDGAKIKTGFG